MTEAIMSLLICACVMVQPGACAQDSHLILAELRVEGFSCFCGTFWRSVCWSGQAQPVHGRFATPCGSTLDALSDRAEAVLSALFNRCCPIQHADVSLHPLLTRAKLVRKLRRDKHTFIIYTLPTSALTLQRAQRSSTLPGEAC